VGGFVQTEDGGQQTGDEDGRAVGSAYVRYFYREVIGVFVFVHIVHESANKTAFSLGIHAVFGDLSAHRAR
jgi:hypothetical protein